MSRPPSPTETAILAACTAAKQSPCQKSKRGAVVFNPLTGMVCYAGWNSRPDNKCDELCQPRALELIQGSAPGLGHVSRCATLCVHAEVRAIRLAGYLSERSQFVGEGIDAFVLTDCELVHAKVDARGQLVPSGGPSCWQCAKEIADTGLLGVWLYEKDESFDAQEARGLAKQHNMTNPPFQPYWNFYPNKQFYELTLRECNLVRS